MRASAFLYVACLVAVGWCKEDKQLIMLEIERLNYPADDKVVKRQAQVQYGGAPGQFVLRASDDGSQQQVPPEYLSLLQQLSPQQQQHDIQQLYVTRNPQEAYAEYSSQPAPAPVPPRPRLTPEQEQMRRLQEAQANKHIREQQERALQRALQTGQFQPGFQPQSYQPQQPSYQPSYQQPQVVYQPQPQEYQQQPQALSQYDTSSSYELEPQYSQSPTPQYYQQPRSISPAQTPQKFSYSQVQFGGSNIARETLEPRLLSIQQKLQSQVKSPPQPEYYSSQPEAQEDYSAYNVQGQQQQTPTQPQHPEQYLIETTRPDQSEEPVVRIPRPSRPPPPNPQSLYYRPESKVAESLYVKSRESYAPASDNYQPPRQYALVPQYVPRAQNLPISHVPSRSAIYVQQSGITKRITTQQPPSYSRYTGYHPGVPRIPTPQGQRPLTASEIEALSKAGFQISSLTLNSLQEPSEISPSYDDDSDIYRSPNSKRQSLYVDESKPPGKYPKRIPKPVPLTETERKLLAEQGIRNLYRVESSESKDAPVTYVLAIDNTIMKRESESTTEEKKPH